MIDLDDRIVSGFRLALKRSGRTLRSLSGATGLPYRSLQNYLAGTSKMPASVMLRLCLELGIDDGFLLYEGSFLLPHAALKEALFSALGDAVLQAPTLEPPKRIATLSQEQQRALDQVTMRVNAAYDAERQRWWLEPPEFG